MRLTRKRRKLVVAGTTIHARRTTGGVLELYAGDDVELATGLGFAHAHDRMVQMMLVRLIAQGRLSECLKSNEETNGIDVFMRQMGLARSAAEDADHAAPGTLRYAEAYAEGVNAYIEGHRRPLELVLAGFRPEPWTVADTLATIQLMSYIGLAQTQQDMEKLIIQAIRAGVSVRRLKRLFTPHLDGLDYRIVEWTRMVRVDQPLVPDSVRFLSALPRLVASNNWAVAGHRTTSGHPFQCNDPHLECNRLPAIWYETLMHTTDDYRIGITMPGVPGLVMGRTRNLSFGFTYGFMDTIDYFIEECRGRTCRRSDGFRDLDTRHETIERRNETPMEITIYSSDRGVLETEPFRSGLEDGFYLARAWSGQHHGASRSVDALSRILGASKVADAQEIVREVSISCNWVLADRDGAIGYQQSGLLPARSHSGLHPVPAWDERFAWRGLVPAERLHTFVDPEEGFVATANNELNPPNGPLAVNLPMAPYRADRISALLAEDRPLTLDDMKRIQLDLYSVQAERLMELLRPHLPDTPAGSLLAEWDLRYDRDSCAATLFEDLYHALLRRVFGDGMFGAEAWDTIVSETAMVAAYYGFFDRVLLAEDSDWYGEAGRDAVLREVVEDIVGDADVTAIERWGERLRVTMTNVFFAGTLPSWLGFDHGPIELAGGRSTVVQAGVFTAHGRLTSFHPSYRFVTDLGSDEADTVLAGGPSGRRTSPWYRTDVDAWLGGDYKTLSATTDEG